MVRSGVPRSRGLVSGETTEITAPPRTHRWAFTLFLSLPPFHTHSLRVSALAVILAYTGVRVPALYVGPFRSPLGVGGPSPRLVDLPGKLGLLNSLPFQNSPLKMPCSYGDLGLLAPLLSNKYCAVAVCQVNGTDKIPALEELVVVLSFA